MKKALKLPCIWGSRGKQNAKEHVILTAVASPGSQEGTMRKMVLAVLLAGGIGAAACDVSPTDSGNVRPEYYGKNRTRTQSTTAPGDSTSTQPGIGEPCNPETYSGPYNCVADPNSVSGYIVAY